MVASALAWENPVYRAQKCINTIEPNLYRIIAPKNYTTTTQENSIKTTLVERIENVAETCKKDGWANDKTQKSCKIREKSIYSAINFAKFIENIEMPAVIPYYNGSIGFEWILKDGMVTILFETEGKFIYSIYTDDVNEYGEIKQTIENQQDMMDKVWKIIKNV